MNKLIIFDCDGVLVDSEHLLNKVFANALLNYGYSISLEESIKKFTGVHEDVCREIIMKETQVDIPLDYWVREQSHLLKTLEIELTSLLNPVLDKLETLKIPKCVASNSPKHHVMHCLELTHVIKYFDQKVIFTSQQVSKPKPAPDLFLFAAKSMGIEPKNCIVIEDSLAGIQAAKAAGMQVMMFLGGTHARFDWYRDKMARLNAPIFFECDELFDAIECALNA
jgi:HAD superfamily hydrolase (TIGR01509 family)